MTLGKRKKILRLLIITFVVLGTAVVLYVNGWRFDIATLKVEKIGGIFIKSFPENARISLDNKLVSNQSGFFGKGTLINNLLPRSYRLKLELENYEVWEENVTVLPSLAIEINPAVLVPNNPLSIATNSPKDFWVAGGNVVLQSKSDLLSVGNKKIGKGTFFGSTEDGNTLLIKDPILQSYYLVDVKKNTSVNLTSLFKKVGLSQNGLQVFLDPQDENKLILSKNKNIYSLDIMKAQLTNLYKTTYELGERIAISQFLLAWTKMNPQSGTSTIIVFDKFLKRVLDESPSIIGGNLDLQWANNKKLIALQNDGGLYVYDFQEKSQEKMATGVKKFALTTFGSAFAALEPNALETFSLDNNQEYHRFNLPEVQSVIDINWYGDGNHIFLSYPERTVFLDLNDAALGNLITVSTNYKKVIYDEKNNSFYSLKVNRIEKLDFPK